MSEYFNFNGKWLISPALIVGPDNRGLRYGEGLFETMRCYNGEIAMEEFHFDRLFAGMELLHFAIPAGLSTGSLRSSIKELCEKNGLKEAARIRLAVFRGDGGPFEIDNQLTQYTIQSWPLMNTSRHLNVSGLDLEVFPDARKSCDLYANLKSANYLPYLQAAFFAKANRVDEALVLNQYGRICDGTVSNLFWITKSTVNTVPLSEGCIAGVMRRALIQSLPALGYEVCEKACSIENLLEADELFLSNAISRIRWVKQFRNKTFTRLITDSIFHDLQNNVLL